MRGHMRPALTHVALHVRDLEAMIHFYREFCGLQVTHQRESSTSTDAGDRVVWMAEAEREEDLVFVLIPGGRDREQSGDDYSHFGFAVASRDEVDRIADLARGQGRLVWEPREDPYPVGYYCGVRDPNGNFVEFSYGQPLGPGCARELD